MSSWKAIFSYTSSTPASWPCHIVEAWIAGDMSNRAKSSLAFTQLNSRLKLTLDHMDIVHQALSDIAASQKPLGPLVRHAIRRNQELAVQLLYTHLNEYLRSLISEMLQKKSLEVVNKAPNSSLHFHEIVHLGSYDAICHRMIDSVFESLTKEKSTKKLIDKILDKTGVIPRPLIFKDAMFYLEIRHLIVHNASRMDKSFVEHHGSRMNCAKAGNMLSISIGLARKAITSVRELCQDIDNQLILKEYLDPHNADP